MLPMLPMHHLYTSATLQAENTCPIYNSKTAVRRKGEKKCNGRTKHGSLRDLRFLDRQNKGPWAEHLHCECEQLVFRGRGIHGQC
jgi:hypothetical protein